MRAYILRVICTGILCTFVMAVFQNNDNQNKIMRMLCGVFMLISIISPLIDQSNLPIRDYTGFITDDTQQHITSGADQAAQYRHTFIKDTCEAYIVEKAAQMGVDIDAEVILNTNDHPIPHSVTISGTVSPYIKSRLQLILTEDLDIPKERQKWI